MVKLKQRNRLSKIQRNRSAQPLKLDLGAGLNTREGFIGVDNASESTAKIKHDLTVFPWPFDDESVDEVYSCHFLEHIPGIVPRDTRVNVIIDILLENLRGLSDKNRNTLIALLNPPPEGRVAFFDELYRVMKMGAKATFITPYWSSMRAVQDPTHAWPSLCEASFLYFNRGWREQNKLTHYLGKCNFNFTYGRNLDVETSTKNQETQNFWANRYVNSATDLILNLEKIL